MLKGSLSTSSVAGAEYTHGCTHMHTVIQAYGCMYECVADGRKTAEHDQIIDFHLRASQKEKHENFSILT